MSDSQPIVAKSSKRSEHEPSVGCDPGTVDRLNEAPRIELMKQFIWLLGLGPPEGLDDDAAEQMLHVFDQLGDGQPPRPR